MIHGWALALAAGTMLLTLVPLRSAAQPGADDARPSHRGRSPHASAPAGRPAPGAARRSGSGSTATRSSSPSAGSSSGRPTPTCSPRCRPWAVLAMLSVLAAAACVAQIGRPGLYLVGYGLARCWCCAWVVGSAPIRRCSSASACPPTSWPPSAPSSAQHPDHARPPTASIASRRRSFPPTTRLDARALTATRRRSRTSACGTTGHSLRTFAQLQEIRTYYKFVDVDNDRYTDQRRVPPAHAVPARALVSASAGWTELDQRAPDLHPRLRRGGGPGQPDHARGAARVLRQGHPAAVRPAASRPSRDRRSTTARSPTSTSSSARAPRSSTIRAGTRTSTRATPGAGACRSTSWLRQAGLRAPASASRRSSSPTTSRLRAGSSSTGRSRQRIAADRARSSATTAIPTW